MEKLVNIYKHDINRELKNVIKVDEETFTKQELEEYVVTEEILRNFNKFFEAYNYSIDNITDKVGVFIKGFYGSGKSHFLKILSYLLENKKVDGKNAVEYFSDKIQDAMLLANIKRSGNIPTDVLLFDIPKKASLDTENDSILAIFEKVFNEKMGLSTIPQVAEFERVLIKDNKYEAFKSYFKEKSQQDWEESRNDFYFRRDEIIYAYSKSMNKTEQEAEFWFDNAEQNYKKKTSIENFAKRIKEYIEEKNDNRHVVFLADEMGAYIGRDGQRMLQLQAMVEELGIECGGKAWVIVTSQQDVGNIIKVLGNDFSKIQDRFDTKINLTSTEADVVIKKRILEKTNASKETLKLFYDQKASIISNAMNFKESQYQKIYDSADDFANTYPFVNYQIGLLQKIFINLRDNEYVFQNTANGERTLLSAFWAIAKKNEDKEIGYLTPFYEFYETLTDYFKDNHTDIVVANAEEMAKKGILQDADVKVLKILFMLKQIKEIPAKVDNIAVLCISKIDEDMLEIKSQIKDSLVRLENQTLIQRVNTDEYVFLTNEEQEINKDIKKIANSIDESKITDYLKKIIFDNIYPDTRHTYKGGIFYLSKYLNDVKYSQDYSIGIKVYTFYSDQDDTRLRINSSGDKNFIYVKLEISALTNEDIRNILAINDYLLSKAGVSKSDQVQAIEIAKRSEANKTNDIVKNNIKEQLRMSAIYIGGDEQRLSDKEAKTKLNDAVDILIDNVYKKFSHIQKNYTEQDIKNLFKENRQMTLGNEIEFPNQKAYDDILNYCLEKEQQRMTISIRSILKEFENAPYGFPTVDILYLLTRLLKDEKISLIYNDSPQSITSEETLTKIIKRDYYDRTIVKVREKVDIQLVEDLRFVANNVFGFIDLPDTEDEMVKEFKLSCLEKEQSRINGILTNYRNSSNYKYPGEQALRDFLEEIKKIDIISDINTFFETVSREKQTLKESYEKSNKVVEFFSNNGGNQREIFDKTVHTLVIYDNNEDFVNKTKELNELVSSIKDIINNSEPYIQIPELPTLNSNLIEMLTTMYEEKSKPIIELAKNSIEKIQNEVKENEITSEFEKKYIDILNNITSNLERENELRDIYAQDTRIKQLIENFEDELQIEIDKKNALNREGGDTTKTIVRTRVKLGNLMKSSYQINCKEDIENYIEELRTKLLEEFNKNNNLTIG